MRTLVKVVSSLSIAFAFGACGPAEIMGPETPPPTGEGALERPVLTSVAPVAFSVGETVDVVGQDFPSRTRGTLALQITGTFTAEDGTSNAYDGEFPLSVKNEGAAEFEFGPNVAFAETGDKIGVLVGSARLVARSNGADGSDELASDTQDVSLTVEPSIILDRLTSIDGDCAPMIEGTTVDANLALAVRAIGVGAATPGAPITFRFGFNAPQIKAQFVEDVERTAWPWNPSASQFAESPDGAFSLESQITGGNSFTIEPRGSQRAYRANPAPQIAGEYRDSIRLLRLWAGPVNGPGHATTSIFVEAQTADGQRMSRVIAWKINNQAEVGIFNATDNLVERYEVEQVCGCIAGGDIGRDLQYSETTTKTMSRSVGVNWNVSAGQAFGLNAGIQLGTGMASPISFGVHLTLDYNANWSQAFGTDQRVDVSTSDQAGITLSAHIIPTFYGTCYRQTERKERIVPITYHNACGESADIGEAILTDWNYGFDIASGASCPPETSLPPAEQFESAAQ